MAQNNSLKIKNKPDGKKIYNKNINITRKNKPEVEVEKQEVLRNIKKQIHKSQAKIYKSIENKIIAKAKDRRENFEII